MGKKLKQQILVLDINILRVSSVSELFLQQNGVNDVEDIECILLNIRRLISEQSEIVRNEKVMPPMEYLCPLSFVLMTDPVTISGQSYQRNTDPNSGKCATANDLTH